jgi:large subunit ribosomal protein L30
MAEPTSTPATETPASSRNAATGAKRLKLQLVRSPIGNTERQRATVHALGLRKLHQVVEHNDSPVTRGMVKKVSHLVRIIEEPS